MTTPSQPNRERLISFLTSINPSTGVMHHNDISIVADWIEKETSERVAQALAEQRQGIVKMIESRKFGSLPTFNEKITTSLMRDIYNHAYDEIIASITDAKE